MRRSVVLSLALGAALAAPVAPVSAQTLASEDPVLRRIWDEAMNNSRVESMAQALLDSIGPRLTGSPHSERAQEWAVKMLGSWGIPAEREQYGTWEG